MGPFLLDGSDTPRLLDAFASSHRGGELLAQCDGLGLHPFVGSICTSSTRCRSNQRLGGKQAARIGAHHRPDQRLPVPSAPGEQGAIRLLNLDTPVERQDGVSPNDDASLVWK